MSDNKMNAKKVLGFLLCTPAFTRRNITSLLLVGGFFFVYVLAGGKIDTELPNARQSNTFGGSGLDLTGSERSGVTRQEPATEILGEVTPQERRSRETAPHMKGRVFTDEDADQAPPIVSDRSGLIQQKYKSPESIIERRAIERSKKRAPDPLEAIEERLRHSR